MSYLSYVGKLISNVKGFYNEINAATLTGAIDAIIIQQEDGTFLSSPFHVRFGKLGVLHAKEKVVEMAINGKPVDLQMKLGDSGEAFFVTEVEELTEDVPAYLATSPIPSAADLMEKGVQELKEKYLQEETGHEPDVRIQVDSEESQSKTRRRKKRTLRKKLPTDSTSVVEEKIDQGDADIPLFDMDDVSSDEELANMPPMPAFRTMGKSVSLPVMEESKLQRTSEWASSQYNTFSNLHPFSDTDISPLVSPASTRPPSPKSDTEVDRQKQGEVGQSILSEEDSTMWEWGDLPRRSVDESIVTIDSVKEHTSSQIADSKSPQTFEKIGDGKTSGGLFQFMKQTKSVRHKPEVGGIYLDDLNIDEMDPEVAKLYFPKRFAQSPFVSIKEEDTESGRGASLPVSPHSVEGAIGGPSVSFLQSEVRHLGTYSMSLCGGLADPEGVTLDKFMQSVVTYEDLCENYNMINNPDLVVRIGDKFYNWATATPIIMSQIVFERDLPEMLIHSIMEKQMPKKKEKKGGRVSSWFSWRRAAPEETPSGTKLDSSSNSQGMTSDTDITATKALSDASMVTSPPVSSPSSTTGTPQKQRKRNNTSDSLKADDEHTSSEADTESERDCRKDSKRSHQKEKFKKTLRLTSEQIEKLNLRDGANEMTFSVTTQYQGTTKCTCHVYLWKYNDKIVISDIDGTITKSDVLGQILPIIGKDWSQSGVAQLYTNIESNGYKFLYLSARAIGQFKITKDLLKSIKQEVHVLPEGPLLLSPTSLVSAFHREVIEKKPENFKIACLKDIGELFPDNQPFYAGFGNKINDVYAYKAIDIPLFRIFTINHKGELKQESTYTFQSSYLNLSVVVDHFFPPLHRKPGMVASEFSATSFWRDPLPSISSEELIDLPTSSSSSSSSQHHVEKR